MKLSRAIVAIMAVGALAACDDDDGTGPDTTSLEGSYSISSFTYTADSGEPSFDLASVPATSGGPYGIRSMVVDENHDFSGTMVLPVNGVPTEFDAGGSITLSGTNTIRIDFDQQTQQAGQLDAFEVGTYTMTGNTLSITLPDVTFDFGALTGNPQGAVDADLLIVGTRS